MDYKRILEGVVNIINTTEKSDIGFVNICSYIGENCPELKESEDEKIRKAILEHIKGIKSWEYFLGISKEQMIAWLEKQGTPAKLSEEEQNRFAKGVLTSCALSFIDYLDAHKYEGKMCVSNGECEDIENAFHNAMWDRLHRYYCKYIEKQSEHILANSEKTCNDGQKPVWSEDDEKIITNIGEYLNCYGNYIVGKNEEKAAKIYKSADWLKDLKDKAQPQTTWKPSDEQMKVLDAAVMHSHLTTAEYDGLVKLREQLKKLKEG